MSTQNKYPVSSDRLNQCEKMYKLIKALISANNWYVTYILHAWIWYNNGLKFGLFLKKLLKI